MSVNIEPQRRKPLWKVPSILSPKDTNDTLPRQEPSTLTNIVEGIFMSVVDPFVMFPKRIMFQTDLSIHTRFLYTLLQHHDRGNGCWASRDRMKNETGLSLYHIRKGLQELEDLGMIKWKRRGQGKTDFIELINTVEEVEEVEEEVVETVSSLEVKSLNTIQYEEEIPEGDIDIDTETPQLDCEQLECEDEETPYLEEETVLRSITHRIYSGTGPIERLLCEDGVIVGSNMTHISIFIPNECWRNHIRNNYIELLENIFGKEVEIVDKNSGR